ncbi:hypothetical protein [Eubacterium sp.]
MYKEQFVKYFAEEDGLTIEQEINDYLSKSMGTVKIVSISSSCALTFDSCYEAKAFVVFEKIV